MNLDERISALARQILPVELISTSAATYMNVGSHGVYIDCEFESPHPFKFLSKLAMSSADVGWADDLYGKLTTLTSEHEQQIAAEFCGVAQQIAKRVPQSHWDPFQCLRRASAFIDYSDEIAARAEDHQKMLIFADEGAPPSMQLLPDCPAWIRDSKMQLKPPPGEVSFLISEVFRYRSFGKFFTHDVGMKIFPSLGARHGIDCFYVQISSSYVNTFFYFDPVDAKFVPWTSENLISVEATAPGDYLVLTCLFDRYLWRYRNGWNYQCIYLDVGHAIQAVKAVGQSETQSVIEVNLPKWLDWGPFSMLKLEPLAMLKVSAE